MQSNSSSISERELGVALQELSQVRHDHRNLRHSVNLLSESHADLKLKHNNLQVRLTTALAVVAGLFGVLGYAIRYISILSS